MEIQIIITGTIEEENIEEVFTDIDSALDYLEQLKEREEEIADGYKRTF